MIGLLGPNGAGKSTTLRIVAGILPTSKGKVHIPGGTVKLILGCRKGDALMAMVKITVRKNGSYCVEAPAGMVELVDANGNGYDLAGKITFSLCRCGASATKPFCDGTHRRIGFQAAEEAVKAEENEKP
jgi:CDGSH-type Zn-finger protein